MNAVVTWQDIGLRLAAAVLAGAIVGFDRGARGEVAGLRTTILICLAAAGAMIEANLMLSVTGKAADSFAVMDALRFPLGILSGIGFIGAGAIIRRGKLVTGVTTAATLWLITVVGLILGAGYFGTGAGMVAIAFVVLFLLKRLEPLLFTEHRGNLTVAAAADGPQAEELQALIRDDGYKISSIAVKQGRQRIVRCRLAWHGRQGPDQLPGLIKTISARKGIVSIRWEPVDAAGHLD